TQARTLSALTPQRCATSGGVSFRLTSATPAHPPNANSDLTHSAPHSSLERYDASRIASFLQAARTAPPRRQRTILSLNRYTKPHQGRFMRLAVPVPLAAFPERRQI